MKNWLKSLKQSALRYIFCNQKLEIVLFISHGASGVNMTFAVREDVVNDVIKSLHDEFFKG